MLPFFSVDTDPGPDFAGLVRRVGLQPPDPTSHRLRGDHPRHDVRGGALCRRRRDGGRPPRHVGQLDQPPVDREGVPGRSALGCRDRRSSRPGGRDGASVPAAARALREGRGHAAQPRGQGQPAQPDAAQPPARSDAGHGRRADLRRLRPKLDASGGSSSTTSPAAATRSPTTPRPAPGRLHAGDRDQARLPDRPERDEAIDLALRRLWQAADEDSATGGPDAGAQDLSRWSPPSPPTGSTVSATPTSRTGSRALIDRRRLERDAESISTLREVSSSMSMPFYVAPEQVMKDRADYARKGIARACARRGPLRRRASRWCAENPSNTLRKISEIYDRIAFAGVGKYNEFDQLAGRRRARTPT
jgi:hypothetical protein